MSNSFVKQKFMKWEENRADHRKGFQELTEIATPIS